MIALIFYKDEAFIKALKNVLSLDSCVDAKALTQSDCWIL